jgi:fibro-slime domain-containing protein
LTKRRVFLLRFKRTSAYQFIRVFIGKRATPAFTICLVASVNASATVEGMKTFVAVLGAGLIGFVACSSKDGSLFPEGGGPDAGVDAPFGVDLIDVGLGGDGGNPNGDSSCTPQLVGVLRDFRGADEPGGHPDFESVVDGRTGLDLNSVSETLGADRKPVFNGPSKSTTTKANFDQWFRDTAGVNKTERITLPFVIEASGRTTFDSAAFFPLDGKGFGNTPNQTHNYGFTYELHTEFLYRGGEQFTFRGDDDVWVFVNNKRIIDLGGVHSAETASVNVDALASQLGIVKGQAYPFDFFFAERHTVESNFRLETTLKFVNCEPILPN